ncbi:hypothetical protein ACFYP4_21550 [Streptomyces sp. NPDC005551]|uniref:hypothetical protein n=1 Tax=unclassified Streptomyces TaxID=2593676 RepID=UPI003402B118
MSFEQQRDTTEDTGAPQDGPTGEERAAWEDVRRRATGMSHHESKAARDAARHAAKSDALTDGETARADAEVEEWERVTDALADHAGTYDPEIDPFVQGEKAARTLHAGRTRNAR